MSCLGSCYFAGEPVYVRPRVCGGLRLSLLQYSSQILHEPRQSTDTRHSRALRHHKSARIWGARSLVAAPAFQPSASSALFLPFRRLGPPQVALVWTTFEAEFVRLWTDTGLHTGQSYLRAMYSDTVGLEVAQARYTRRLWQVGGHGVGDISLVSRCRAQKEKARCLQESYGLGCEKVKVHSIL